MKNKIALMLLFAVAALFADSSKLSAVITGFSVTPTRSVSQLPEALAVAQPSEIQERLGGVIPILKKANAENHGAFTRSVNIIFKHDLSNQLITGTMTDPALNAAIMQLYRSFKLEPASISSGTMKIQALKFEHELRGDVSEVPALFFLVDASGEKISVEMMRSLQITGASPDTGVIEYGRNGVYAYKRLNFADAITQIITVTLGPDSKNFTIKLFPSLTPIKVTANRIYLEGPEILNDYDSVKVNGALVKKSITGGYVNIPFDNTRLKDEENVITLVGAKRQVFKLGTDLFPRPKISSVEPAAGFAGQKFTVKGTGLFPLGKLTTFDKTFPVNAMFCDSLHCDSVKTISALGGDSLQFRAPAKMNPGVRNLVISHKWGVDTLKNTVKILPAPGAPKKWYKDWEVYANAGLFLASTGLVWGNYFSNKNYYEGKISRADDQYQKDLQAFNLAQSPAAQKKSDESLARLQLYQSCYTDARKNTNLAFAVAVTVPIATAHSLWFLHWKKSGSGKVSKYNEYKRLTTDDKP